MISPKEYGMEKTKKKQTKPTTQNFTMEKSDKQYFSQVIKFNVSGTSMTFFLQACNLSLIMRKTSDKFQ